MTLHGMKLSGKRIFITGAAKGIGREMAIQLAQKQCALILADRDREALAQTVKACQTIGHPVEAIELDVCDQQAVASLGVQVEPVDVLINNAGTVHGGAFLDVSMGRHQETADVNFTGLMAVTHALLPGMLRQPRATIVNIASAASFVGLPFGTSYAATKWAVLGFAESLRLELRELGHDHVHLIHVCPSYIRGALFEGARPVGPTRLLLPEAVARRVVDAIEHDRNWVRMPWGVAITRLLMAALPRRLADVALRWTGATRSMSDWKGRG